MNLDAEAYALLRLHLSTGIGPLTLQKLLHTYHSATAAVSALELASRNGNGKSISLASQAEVDKVLLRSQQERLRILSLNDASYPPLLKQIADPPAVLFLKGSLTALHKKSLAIVGTRNASAAAMKQTHLIARDLAQQGYCIISGLARGIDGAAHQGALQGNGQTVAVLAGGLSSVYPPEHTPLAEKILSQEGALVSEMPPDVAPVAHHFPRRNRIISGLSRAVAVMECTEKSGSLITARFALEQNRDVFAMPAHPHDPRSKGPNGLLRQGAFFLETAADILEHDTAFATGAAHMQNAAHKFPAFSAPLSDLFNTEPAPHPEVAPEQLASLTPLNTDAPASPEAHILSLLGEGSLEQGELAQLIGLSAAELSILLTQMDLSGSISRLPGNRIGKKATV